MKPWQRKLITLEGAGTYHPLSGQDWGMRIRGRDAWEKFLQGQAEAMSPDSEFIAEIAEITISWIKERVETGADYKGVYMAAYSPRYAELKRKLGLGSIVNLRLFGTLYRNLTYKVMPRPGGMIIRLYFKGTLNDIIAYVHQVGGISGPRRGRFYQKKREHFGLTDLNYNDIQRLFYDALSDWLDKCWG